MDQAAALRSPRRTMVRARSMAARPVNPRMDEFLLQDYFLLQLVDELVQASYILGADLIDGFGSIPGSSGQLSPQDQQFFLDA